MSGAGGMAFSSNGIKWFAAPAYIYSANDLAWNGKKWIAVGFSSPGGTSIGYSNDGINWTTIDGISTLFNKGIGAVWNGSMFVVGGSLGTHTIAYSINGITGWTGVTGSTSIFSTSCNCIGSSIKRNSVNIQQPTIAVGAGSHTIAYSIDGIEWTGLGTYIFDQGGIGVTWNGTMFVAVGQGTNSIAYSSDGINWTGVTQKSIFSGIGYAVAWNGTMFVAVGQGTNSIAYSNNGITWTGLGTSIFSVGGYDVSANNTLWVAVGQGTTNSIAYSTNGITGWTGLGKSIFSINAYGVVFGKIWIAVGTGTNSIAYSTNGITGWTGVTGSTSIFSDSGICVAWNGNIWVAGGQGTNTLAYSTNGITGWTGLGTSIFSQSCNDIAWNGIRFVGVGQDGTSSTIAYSSDGIIWTGLGTSIFSYGGSGVVGNSNIAPVLVDSIITLNSNVLPNTNRLDIFANNYNNRGYSNLSMNIISTSN